MKKTLYTFIILLACFAVGMSFFGVNHIHQTLSTSAKTPQIDTQFKHVTYQAFDHKGHLIKSIQSETLQYDQTNDLATFTKPIITIKNQNQPGWTIRSAQGTSSQKSKIIHLTDKVTVTRLANTASEALSLKTTTLDINPSTQQLDTKAAVTIEQPQFLLNAIGFHADTQNGKIKLCKQSRGIYVPNQD